MSFSIAPFQRTRSTPILPIARRAAILLCLTTAVASAAQFTINGPPGSGAFGTRAVALPNGNIVVTDPYFDAPGPVADVGAAYLFRPDGTLLSTLRGSTANDRVGSGGVTVLGTGNYLIGSPSWNNGDAAGAGALTFARADAGVDGVVSASNSLVGTRVGDFVGYAGDPVDNSGVTLLSNGNYVVTSRFWDNGSVEDASAVTFGSGVTGVSGPVSPDNSLVGGSAFDYLGSGRVTPLPSGNYVVHSPAWDNGALANAGAVTFGSGTGGVAGLVSPANSLTGASAGDIVGIEAVTVLANGNYVVRAPGWDSGAVVDAGAVAFASGSSGIAGLVSVANSLVGASVGDQVGKDGVVALANGNYVVRSSYWDNGGVVDAGAVTFGSGSTGIVGLVSPNNSLVGSRASDFVGSSSVAALGNGNYVVSSASWDNGPERNAGAVTFGSGSNGISGPVSSANSLVGGTVDDFVGIAGVTVLSNGNYVVPSLWWDNGVASNAGAATFGSGTTGISGPVSPTNSLVGDTSGDWVGRRVIVLSNGNYVVLSEQWRNGTMNAAGAATFGSGTSGITGVVSPENSLVGSSPNDLVGSAATALANGNYVVQSPNWDDGATMNAGAATFGSGATGISGPVSPSNSLVGSSQDDAAGVSVEPLTNGNYVVRSPFWDIGSTADVGAVTFGSGSTGISGIISAANSLVGGRPGDSVGRSSVTALSNGDYVVASPTWDDGDLVDVGAVTVGSGNIGVIGQVGPGNSLVGGSAGDFVGLPGGITPFSNAKFAVRIVDWDNGATANAGAITLGLPDGSVVGPVSDTHSVLGEVMDSGTSQVFTYDGFRNQLVVGQSAGNRVILHRTGAATTTEIVSDTPDPSVVGQAVTFTAALAASATSTIDGQVSFVASSGESCVDASPTSTSPTTVVFSCSLVFTAAGVTSVAAEYTGSILHAYSRSAPEMHVTIVDALFATGFEVP